MLNAGVSQRVTHPKKSKGLGGLRFFVVFASILLLATLMVTMHSSSWSSLSSLVLGVSAQVTPPLDYVRNIDKTRTWIPNTSPQFRPNAATAPGLHPRFMTPAAAPRLMSHTLVQTVQGRFVAFGGMMSSKDDIDQPLARSVSNKVMSFNVERNVWYDETPWTSGPAPRIDHVAWVWGDNMFVHGGADTEVFSDVWSYRNRTWKSYPTVFTSVPALKGHTANVLDRDVTTSTEVFMFGGINPDGEVTNGFFKLNNKGVVTPITAAAGSKAPPARAYHAAAVMNTQYDGDLLFISGGTDGKQVFSDLWVYYTKNNTWRFLSDGSSPQTLAYEQDAIIPAFTVPATMKHSCVARFPLLFCVGGNPSNDPISMGFDITLGRWVRQYFTNPDVLLPLSGNRLILYNSADGNEEVISVGGVSGRPAMFTNPTDMFKTAFMPQACDYEYVDGDYEGRCYLCDPGYGADRDLDPHRCFACPAGRYSYRGRCWDCPKSTYNEKTTQDGVESCTSCPPGFFTVDTGADTPALCVTCPPGTYADGPECIDCPAGTYGDVWGAAYMDTGCKPCNFGSFSIEGQTACTSCPAGTSTGPFQRNMEPYQFYIKYLAQTPITPTGCQTGVQNLVTRPILAEETFWLTVGVKDFGTNHGIDGMELRLAMWANSLRAYFEFSGAAQYVHVNCISTVTDPGPTCGTRLAVNQTASFVRNSRGQTGMCNNDYIFTYPIRIADAGVTQLRIGSNGAYPIRIDIPVVATPWVRFESMVDDVFLANSPTPYRPFRILAFSGGNIKAFMNYTGTTSHRLRVQCTTGSTSVDLAVNFVNGVFQPAITFPREASNCRPFVVNRYGQMAYQEAPEVRFDVQVADTIVVDTVGNKAPNKGIFYVRVSTLQADGTVATADGFTTVRLTVDPLTGITDPVILAAIPTKHRVYMSEQYVDVKLENGVGLGLVTMYSTAARFNISTWSILRGTVRTGSSLPAGFFDRSERFWIVPNNGTRLKLVTTGGYSYPTWISANTTFQIEVQVQSVDGLHDGTRDFYADVTMQGCPASIRVVNISKYGPNRVAFSGGRAILNLFVQGHDTNGCYLNIRPVGILKPYIRDLTTPKFNVITPKRLRHTWLTCPLNIYEGDTFTFNVEMRSSTNLLATMTTMGVIMEVSGNASAIVETSGVYIKPLVNGVATFTAQFLPSTVAVKMVFWAGMWSNEPQYNYTYQIEPYYKRITTFLGYKRVFRKVAYIQETQTCLRTPIARASQIVVTSRTPVWTEHNQPFVVSLEAVTQFGMLDTSYSQPITIRVKNCAGGVEDTMKWAVENPATGSRDAIYTTGPMSSTTVWNGGTVRFTGGKAAVTLYPSFTIDGNRREGVKFCSVIFGSTTLSPGIVEGFQVRHTYPSCTLCKPGTWSRGGDGTLGAPAFHPGGCVPCMVGTFSAESGATDVTFCEACLKDYGFPTCCSWLDNTAKEGAISCESRCSNGNAGRIGGGPCTSANSRPAGYNRGGDEGVYGRTSAWCQSAACYGVTDVYCPAGKFWLDCTVLTTEDTCLTPFNLDQCIWNTITGTCTGTEFTCTNCPAGTGRSGDTQLGLASACPNCQAGGWQTGAGNGNRVQVTYTLSPRYCGSPLQTYTEWMCRGAGRQECPAGTYSSTMGATSSDVCQECPAGHYCAVRTLYQSRSNCGGGCGTPSGAGPCPHGASGCNTCVHGSVQSYGATAPVKCPPGTYNNLTGQGSVSACIDCWAGTYCPAGSVYPLITDTLHTEKEMEGDLPPSAVSFYGSHDYVSCTNAATSDGSGYIRDGHFDFDVRGFTSPWLGSFVYTTDRFNSATSRSIRTNSSGGAAYQVMNLAHELPIEMVARAWIQYNLQSGNLAGVLPPGQFVTPFAGIEVTVQYVDVLTGDPSETETFSLVASPAPSVTWQLLELAINPSRPIRFATMRVSARGFYLGYALFDDVSFRPAHNRICMCSTGFFYNYSDPVKMCQRCKPGFACSGGTLHRCVYSWSCAAAGGCQPCRDGWLCDSDGRGRHIPCNKFTYKNDLTEQCLPCPIGHSCRDGIKYECNDGTYGDGGIECITCKPGFYSPATGPQAQCVACPPGHTSQAGRSSCFPCPVNHYSPDGTECFGAPVGYFVPAMGSATPKSCLDTQMDAYSVTIPRNRHGYVIRAVPRICDNHYDYEVTRVEHVANPSLGTVRISKTAAAVLYDAGPNNAPQNTHTFKVFFTSNVNAPEQYATISVTLTNTPMQGVNDELWVPHPMEQDTTYRITTWLSNNVNREHDWIYLAQVKAPVAVVGGPMPAGEPRVAQYDMGANPSALLSIDYSLRHPAIVVTLPKGFRGPMHIRPITFDQQCTSATANCLETTPHDLIKITARTRPPVAVNDFFRVQVGQVVPLDILKNDYDPENDVLSIIRTTASSRTLLVPAIQRLCTVANPTLGTCSGCSTTRVYPICSCIYAKLEDRCRTPDLSQSQYFVDYVSSTGVCGLETFTYTIATNDGESTATVTVDNYRCYCAANRFLFGAFNIIFVLDGTASVSDYGAQLAFADGVIKRSQSGTTKFYYGIVEVGVNKIAYPLSNIHPDVGLLKRDVDGDTFIYALGAGIELAKNMYTANPPRNTWVVVLSTKEGADNLGGIRDKLPNARYITISINPTGEHFLHWGAHFGNIHYSKVVHNTVELNAGASIQEELMDLMCGSGWG